MHSSPFEGRKQGLQPTAASNIFSSPGPARQLFTAVPPANTNNTATANNKNTNTPKPVRKPPPQPVYDFIGGGGGGPSTPSPALSKRRPRTPRSAVRGPMTPGSVRRAPVVPKFDQSNEIIRGDLNSVRYELQTLQEERALEKIRHEQEIRTLEAAVEVQSKRADVFPPSPPPFPIHW